jgi:hypothetical protein
VINLSILLNTPLTKNHRFESSFTISSPGRKMEIDNESRKKEKNKYLTLIADPPLSDTK